MKKIYFYDPIEDKYREQEVNDVNNVDGISIQNQLPDSPNIPKGLNIPNIPETSNSEGIPAAIVENAMQTTLPNSKIASSIAIDRLQSPSETGEFPVNIDGSEGIVNVKPNSKEISSLWNSHLYLTYTDKGHPLIIIVNEQQGQYFDLNNDGSVMLLGSQIKENEYLKNEFDTVFPTKDTNEGNYMFLISDRLRIMSKQGDIVVTSLIGNIIAQSSKDMDFHSLSDINIVSQIINQEAENKIIIKSQEVEMGLDDLKALIKETFLNEFYSHYHIIGFPNTSTPVPNTFTPIEHRTKYIVGG